LPTQKLVLGIPKTLGHYKLGMMSLSSPKSWRVYNSLMSDLRRIREVNWDEIEAEEVRLLRQLTPEEGIRHFFDLQATLEFQFQATEGLFRPEREAYLIALQSRLARFQALRGHPMDILIKSVLDMQRRLIEAGIDSVLIGGLAVSAWGEPRGTRDVDLKVLLKREDAQRLLDVLGADFAPVHADPLQAIRRNGILFVHNQQNVRIDLLLADTDFDEAAIRRGRSIELQPGQAVRVCSPEDFIVYKLLAPRGRDYDDIVGVIQRQRDTLDDAYVIRWLREFERALDDSTLVSTYQQMRQNQSRKWKG
jgi:hypothetical protein